MPEYWFISDTHFRHDNIVKHCKRPFRDAAEQDAVIIENWNKLVKPGDIVFHHGDFGFFRSTDEANKVLASLNGNITLIKGNHDSSKLVKKMKFADVLMMKEWRLPPNKIKLITMCHYPMDAWRGSHRGEWHTHGHTHAQLPRGHRLRIDVGVDSKQCKKGEHPQQRFRPIHVDEIVKEFKRQMKAGWMSEIEKHDLDKWDGKARPEVDSYEEE